MQSQLDVSNKLFPVAAGICRHVAAELRVVYAVADAIAIRGHGGKPTEEDDVRGEGAGGEDDVIEVGVGRVLEEGEGSSRPLTFGECLEGKQVAVETLAWGRDGMMCN